MRIDVVGPGAVGGMVAALLAEAGEDVAVVARENQVEALAESGLTLRTPARTVHVRPAVLSRGRVGADLTLLAVKTQDVEEACARVAPGPGAVAVLANGLVAEQLAARRLPGRRITPTVLVVDSTLEAPGRISLQRPGAILLPPDAPAEADLLGRAFPVERRSDFTGARWTKLLVNLGNGLNAATGRAAQETYRGVGSRIGVRLIREGLAVAEAEGIAPAPIPWADPRQLRLLTSLPEAAAGPLLSLRVRLTFGRTPVRGSTLESLRRGRSTEIRHLNGAIVERGSARGVPTPANRAIVEAVERAEKGEGPFAPQELMRWIRAGQR